MENGIRWNAISSSKLRGDIYEALRLWNKTNNDTSPLEYLYLFQKALSTGTDNPGQISNQILEQAVEVLEVEYGAEEAGILRMRFRDKKTIHTVANHLSMADVTISKKQSQAIDRLAGIVQDMERQARDERLNTLENQLDLPPHTQLIGVDEAMNSLLELVLSPEASWLVSIEGLGGIGKTALGNALVREISLTSRFHDLAWVSAKQQDFLPGIGSRPTNRPALDIDTLTDSLLEQLEPATPRSRPPPEKRASLTQLLKKHPYLVVIDNLETVVDYQELLPTLIKSSNPSKFLITSRYGLRQTYSEVSCFSVKELSLTDTITLLRHEAKIRRLAALADASSAQLESIYEVAGGNPLALKLIVGQMCALPLSQVLESLKEARGSTIEELYKYIYWQAWQALNPASRKALLVMPVVQNGTFDQLAEVSKLDVAELNQAIQQLVTFSLLEVSGNIDQRRYRIHRLTETFILTEVAGWT